MASFTINYPDELAQRILDEFCEHHGYKSQVLDSNDNPVPNPETKPQFLKRMVKEYIKASWRANEVRKAQRLAAATAIADVDSADFT